MTRENVARIDDNSLLRNLFRSVNKKTYLDQFNARVNGPLHEQAWVKEEALHFHKRMANLNQFFCNNCNEL